jgi:hypothetical protein
MPYAETGLYHPAAAPDKPDHVERVAPDGKCDFSDASGVDRDHINPGGGALQAAARIGEALGAHLRELKQRLVELEQRQLKLGGTYKSGVTYDENTLVSFQGGLWLSRSTTTARPGSGSPAWRLAVKRGDAE